MQLLVEADHLAADVDQELAPQPFVFARFGVRTEFLTAAGELAQDIAQRRAIGHLEVECAWAEAGAVRRVRYDRQVHVRRRS